MCLAVVDVGRLSILLVAWPGVCLWSWRVICLYSTCGGTCSAFGCVVPCVVGAASVCTGGGVVSVCNWCGICLY